MPGVRQGSDPVETSAHVVLVDALDGVELDPGAAAGEPQVIARVGDHVAVADDDPARVGPFLHQQVELGVTHGPARGVGRDGDAGPSVGARRRTQRPLLDRAQDPVAADLPDDARPDARVVDTHLDVAHDPVRQGVHREGVEACLVEVRPAVVARPHDDGHPCRLGHPAERFGTTPEALRGAVDDGRPAGLPEPSHLLDRERLVSEQPRAAVLGQQVYEHVLMRQHDAQVHGPDGTAHGHHGRGRTPVHGVAMLASASGTPGYRGTSRKPTPLSNGQKRMTARPMT